jgi:hypothetical protein
MDNNRRLQDRSQAKAVTGTASESAVRTDSPASAALAEAIKSARESAKLTLPIPEAKAADSAGRSPGAFRLVFQAAIALLLVGAGWSASYLGTLANRGAIEKLEAETARSQEILARLSSDLASLKNTAAAFRRSSTPRPPRRSRTRRSSPTRSSGSRSASRSLPRSSLRSRAGWTRWKARS